VLVIPTERTVWTNVADAKVYLPTMFARARKPATEESGAAIPAGHWKGIAVSHFQILPALTLRGFKPLFIGNIPTHSVLPSVVRWSE
jgi:hypothetical protein